MLENQSIYDLEVLSDADLAQIEGGGAFRTTFILVGAYLVYKYMTN